MSKNVLLLSPQMLKDRTAIHTNIDEKLLYPEIKAAQDMYIHPILGTALFNKIVTDIDSTGTTTGDYKTLLDDYIVDTLMYYVLAGLPMGISFQFWNKGVVRKQGDSTELPSMGELIDLSNHYRQKADWYAERLKNYLIANADETTLSEYVEPGDSSDTINPSNAVYNMPIWLGGDYTNCCEEDE